MVGFAEQRPEDAVGGLAQRRAGDAADGRAGEPAVGLEPLQELGDQPRLAGARLADQAHDLGAAPLHPLERREQLVELVGAPDQRGREPVGREPARRSRLGERAEQAMDHDRLRLAAQRQLARRLEREAMPGERVGGVGDQDGSRRGRQEPGRRIHRVARHRVGGSRRMAEAAGHDRAGVDADVKRHRLAEPCRPLIAEPRAAAEHVERGVERPLRIVLMGDRCAEHRHHGIAHELFDEAVVARDRLGERLEQRILERAHLLGVEPLGQRGETRDVGEQHGHLPPVRVALDGIGRCGAVRGRGEASAPLAGRVPHGEPGSRAAPQRGQNAKSASHEKPHAEQGVGCRRPQRGQKAKPGDSSKPQPMHAIEMDRHQ